MAGDISRQNGKRGGRHVSSKTLQTQLLRAQLTKRFAEKADAIFDAWQDLALGHYIMVKNPLTGEQRVYKKGPNGMAIKDMVEQVMGKAKQTIEINTEEEPQFDLEALQRMGKYVEPTDAEFTELVANPAQPAFAAAIEHKPAVALYSLRGMGKRPEPRAADPAEGVDKNNAQKQG